jgi:hypothetical protein
MITRNWVGREVLITTDNWFTAPDGERYNSVFGILNGIFNDEEILGIKTNARSTNWYVGIGKMIIVGCQIHYAIQCDEVSFEPPTWEIQHEDKTVSAKCAVTRIYHSKS